MTISTLLGSRLLSGLAAFAISGSLLGGVAMASQPEADNPVREIRHEVRDQSKAAREQIEQLRGEFAAEYAKDAPDQAKLAQLHEAIEAERERIADMRFEALMKMHDELDAEQRAKMLERMAHKRGKHDGDKSKGKGKGKGKGKHAKADRPDQPDQAERPDRPRERDDREAARGEAKRDLAKRSGKGKPKPGKDAATKGAVEAAI